MNSGQLVDYEIDSGVAVLRMRDEAGRNALSHAMTHELEQCLASVRGDDRIKVVVLTGLPEYFCTGASREVLDDLVDNRRVPGDLLLPRALLDIPVPVIAAMEGHAIGGGLAVGLCADLTVLALESRYGCSFMNYGFTPGVGTTRLLEHVVGPALAHEMLLTGRAFKGAHFAARGAFNYVLRRADVLAKAMDLAQHIAEKPRVALAALKLALSSRKREMFEAARGVEILMHQITFARPETTQLIDDVFPARTT
jgi:polyketide biosynthesis enoyl-CoA hydratase PksI